MVNILFSRLNILIYTCLLNFQILFLVIINDFLFIYLFTHITINLFNYINKNFYLNLIFLNYRNVLKKYVLNYKNILKKLVYINCFQKIKIYKLRYNMRVTLYYTLKRVRKILCRYCVHRLITSWTTLNTQSVCIVDDTVDFIFSIFYSKNTMDYTVYIECLHYVSHCRCLDEQGALSFPYFIPKAIAVCWIKAQPQDIKLLDLAWLPLGLA